MEGGRVGSLREGESLAFGGLFLGDPLSFLLLHQYQNFETETDGRLSQLLVNILQPLINLNLKKESAGKQNSGRKVNQYVVKLTTFAEQ